MTEEEIEDMDKEIKAEEEDPDSPMSDDEDDVDTEQEEETQEEIVQELFEPVEMSEEDRNLITKMTAMIDRVELDNEEKE